MVLAEIGQRLANALRKMTDSTVLNQEVITEMLTEIGAALMAADVDIKLVVKLRVALNSALKLENLPQSNRRNAIKKAVFDELCKLLDPGVTPFKPVKGKPNVIMFVGLQGSGKTTTVGKLALHYKKKGFKPGMICADTFRAGALHQLKQNAIAVKVPYYGDHEEQDPVKVSADGVEHFKNLGHDLIIVDTSGRHKQEEGLFEEMELIQEAVNPDQVIFVMDGSIGQAAFAQAEAFKSRVKVGAVIITKLDGHAKGGGALSAVAATQSPIIFLGTGEHMEKLDAFEPQPFVSKLLGWGDWKGLFEMVKDFQPGKDSELGEHLKEGKYTLRDFKEHVEAIVKMGPLGKVMEMFPGFNQLQESQGELGTQKMQGFMVIMDSMTDAELDGQCKVKEPKRISRIAKGSGHPTKDVEDLLKFHQMFEGYVGGMSKATKGGKGKPNMKQLQNMLPGNLKQSMGGMNMQAMMKQLGNMNMGSMGDLAKMFGGGK